MAGAGDCVLLLNIGAVDSDQLSLVGRMTSYILLIGWIMVLCLGFPSSLQTDLRIIPQFSATQQFELSLSPVQSTDLFLYLLLNSDLQHSGLRL